MSYHNKFYIVLVFLISLCWNVVHAEQINLTQGKSKKFLYDSAHTSEIVVGDPSIADIQTGAGGALYIFGKKNGATNIFISDSKSQTTRTIDVIISSDIEKISNAIKQMTSQDIQVQPHPKGLIISGEVKKSADVFLIEEYTKSFLDKDQYIINNIKVTSPLQVYLKVRISEVSKSILNEMGFAWESLIYPFNNSFRMGLAQGRDVINAAGNFQRSGNLNQPNSLFLGRNGKDVVNIVLDALETENFSSDLAQPTLIASSGETASFLVGGELPYPKAQNNNISIEFKEFGVRLSFTPTVLSNDLIHLHVRPEVSEPDYSNIVTLPLSNNNTIQIPALKSRRAETSVTLGNGQSLSIAGLFKSKLRNKVDAFPGLSEIPILGGLFTSTSYRNDETELVITVTPYLVSPVDGNTLVLPTDNIIHSTPLEMLTRKPLATNTAKKGDNSVPYLGV